MTPTTLATLLHGDHSWPISDYSLQQSGDWVWFCGVFT